MAEGCAAGDLALRTLCAVREPCRLHEKELEVVVVMIMWLNAGECIKFQRVKLSGLHETRHALHDANEPHLGVDWTLLTRFAEC